MIAVPVKTNSENPALSPLFGKAKWFAFVDKDGVIQIEAFPLQGGHAVAKFLLDHNVKTVLFHHMGNTPFDIMQEVGIECYYHDATRVILGELLKKFHTNQLIKVTKANESQFIEEHSHDHHH